MAKAPKNGKGGKSDPTTEHYKLKTQAVDDLVTADESNSPQVSKAELARYGGRKKGRIPGWLKVAFVKWWFPGSVFYFISMGLGIRNRLDMTVIIGIVLGMVSDLLTDNMVRFIAPIDGEYDNFLMFSKKRYITFVGNIVYAILLCGVVYFGIYPAVNLVIDLGAETRTLLIDLIMGPVGFGLFYVICDMALVGVKYLIKRAIHGSKNKNEQEG